MNAVLTESFLEWYGNATRTRYLKALEREEEMGKHSHPDEDTTVFHHRGYQCEACKGYWAALEPDGGDQPEEIPCLATKGCEGPVVALYPTDEPVPDWIPVIIQGGKA